jgi:hypothetical protein
MSYRGVAPLRMGALLAVVPLLALGLAASAQADQYGEIGHFAVKGTGLGQLTQPTGALGVNSEDNSVYVVDSPTKNEVFRLQKFALNGEGHYEGVASASFEPRDINAKKELFDKIEGVAVDPAKKRVYILAAEERPFCEEEEELKGLCTKLHDEGIYAAAAIFAFSTEQNGAKELVPASGTGQTGAQKGQLVGQAKLNPLGNDYAESPLFEPTGIAVDPVTHELIITGSEDRGKKVTVNEPEAREIAVSLWRLSEKGAIGESYVEPEVEEEPGSGLELFFKECGCVQSPIVNDEGRVFVGANETGIYEIKAPFSEDKAPASAALTFNSSPSFIDFPKQPEQEGGALSIGAEGTIFSLASIHQEPLTGCSGGCPHFPGIVAFSPTFAEEGFAGGQSQLSGNGKCTIELGGGNQPTIAAGDNEDVFVLDDSESSPSVTEYGPGGEGCPHAAATPPAASVEGIAVPESETIAEGKEVTFASKVVEGYVHSVEWEFGDGVKVTNNEAPGTLKTKVAHKFGQAGNLTVTEKIDAGNLASPFVEVKSMIKIAGAPVVATETASGISKTTATLNGSVNPENSLVTKCEFEYGPTTSYGKTVPCTTPPGSGTSPVAVSAAISGLEAGITYYYRLTATNSLPKTSKGNQESFKTESDSGGPGKPTVETKPATEAGNTVTLHATVNPNGANVSKCEFEYGTTTSYGSSAPCASPPGAGTTSVGVSTTLIGLAPGTVYHFRIVAENALGKELGNDGTFETRAEELTHGIEEEALAAAAARRHQEEEAAAAAAKAKAEAEAAAKKKQEEEQAKKSSTKPLTRAQLLAKELETCKKESKKKRARCEATAKKKYGPKKKIKKKKKK